jgi:SpoVK/Ycf46/Vps4 family AAA+-type ATPase
MNNNIILNELIELYHAKKSPFINMVEKLNNQTTKNKTTKTIHDYKKQIDTKEINSVSYLPKIKPRKSPSTPPNVPSHLKHPPIARKQDESNYYKMNSQYTNIPFNNFIYTPIIPYYGPHMVIPPHILQTNSDVSNNVNKELEKNDEKSSKKNMEKEITYLDVSLNTIDDLYKMIDLYDPTKRYSFDFASLVKIKEPLGKLVHMIGLSTIKDELLIQILYFLQEFHKNGTSKQDGEFLHTCIYGPPGTGKTEVAQLIGEIYSKLGILSKGTFRKVTRSDLIAGYLGQTAIKTKKVIQETQGGVLFIDEVYSLGNAEKRDSFSKECIDTLCEALTALKKDWMVIIAGYKREISECFFNYNPGLESRFPWTFHTDKYKPKQLSEILLFKIKSIGWKYDNSLETDLDKWFEKEKDSFEYYGRDVEVLLSKMKITRSKNTFMVKVDDKFKLTRKDLEEGYKLFMNNENIKDKLDHNSRIKRYHFSMYT